MKHITVRQLTAAALVGALYVVMGYFGNIFGLTFGPVQCRFAEAQIGRASCRERV